MKGRLPFYKRFPADFMMGTRDLSLEERAVFNDLLDMLYDKGRPLPNEDKWLANFIGIGPAKFRRIKNSLIDAGKLELVGDYLTNARFEKEMGLERQMHQQAVTWGRMGGKARASKAKREAAEMKAQREPQFDLDAQENSQNLSKKRANSDQNLNTPRESSDKKPRKTADETQAPLKPARATIFQSPEKKDSPSSSHAGAKGSRSKKKSSRASAMPKGWQPKEETDSIRKMIAPWPQGKRQRELERFIDHALDKGRTAKDWDAAWRNWLRKADDDWRRQQSAGERQSGWRIGDR